MGDEGRVKVMVVEDDPEVAIAIGRKLKLDGCDYEMSEDPMPILAKLEAGQADWDVMILDVGLPNISGIEVLKRFRQAGSPISVIMLTGDQTAATATECMRAGAFYYLTKPFRPHELGATVTSGARHCQLSSARRPRCASCPPRSSGSPGKTSRS
jgi:DNA-binding response OmpR family regulator